ncbi:MAG: XRE family transcriptional regulator [Xanthomonadales bacterium PRO7]|nr:XRE family transcriptional regulator [Xanthomonadales bacterium PRO7]
MASRDSKWSAFAKQLGQNLAVLRNKRSWTQADLAEKIGVATETISRYERGTAAASLKTLDALAQILRVPLAELLTASSVRADDQALALSLSLSDLHEADRLVVMDVAQKLCQHLRPTKRRA